ncbi:MAG: hydantoinase/oxoprolinase family protein, partial [Gammaproteobacteria bacterium]|nr:hydantoinase/oxoprolinase family protein [Gammaproteobacteria bacterium]
HERRIGERLRAALPGVPVFLSSEILPEIREFERTSTTAVCAYVGPVLASYLERLAAALTELDLPALHVMGSSGGVLDVAEALRMPAAAVESGPAAGVIAAQRLGDQIGRANLISFDMGGTTAKASLIENGRIETTSEYEVGGQGNVGRWLHGTGHPIRVPVIDLAEVSAGGGSIAWIDPGGALRVGPGSAGAEPGPACYGRGGDRPTVTDANVVLGRLSRTHLLGGRLPIDASAAEAAVRAHVADPLGLGVMEAAAGIVSVVNHGMAEALRIVSVERGHDAREFSLVAFGGAGPVHAAALAEELDIPEVIVPPIPGGFSALGLVATDLRRDWSHTFYSPIESVDLEALNRRLTELERSAEAMLRHAGIPEPDRIVERAADCRYTKQAYELTVPLAGGTVTRESLDALAREFHAQHLRTYGHENPKESVQMVNVRVTATGRMPRVEFHAGTAQTGGEPTANGAVAAEGGAVSDGVVEAEREVWFGEPVRCPVIGRYDLACGKADGGAEAPAGARRAGTSDADHGTGVRAGRGAGTARPGPFIVEEMDCTVVVPPGWSAALDERGFILMARDGALRIPG